MRRPTTLRAVLLATALGLGGSALHSIAQTTSQPPAGAAPLPTPRGADDSGHAATTGQQLHAAEDALEQQDYKTAEARLKALLASSPAQAGDGRVLYDLGFAQERTGEEAEAAKDYAASAAALPGFAEPRIALGLLDARAGRTEAAHAELTQATKLPAVAPYLRARALRALAHLDETAQPEAAREELLEALKLTPETPEDVLMGAELAERAGDTADAETAYRRALQLKPADPEATAGLAHVLQQQHKTAEADELLSAALKASPNDARLTAEAASLYAAEGKADQAIPLVLQLRQAQPALADDPANTALLAQLYTVAGNDAEAEKLDALLVAQQPRNPIFLDDLGSAQVRQGDYAAAQTNLARAVAMREQFHDQQAWATAEAHLAFAASKNHDPQTTLQALSARATVLPNSPSSLFLQATAYDTLHRSKEAAQAYRGFLALAQGKFPDQEFQARHRLIALEHTH